jgi:hypothetical protein
MQNRRDKQLRKHLLYPLSYGPFCILMAQEVEPTGLEPATM